MTIFPKINDRDAPYTAQHKTWVSRGLRDQFATACKLQGFTTCAVIRMLMENYTKLYDIKEVSHG